MPRDYAETPLSPQSPIRVFGLVLLLVFSIEWMIMLCLPHVPRSWRGPIADSLLDASTLTLLTAPAIWFLAVLPLRRLFEARGSLLRRLFASQEQERARLARDLHDSVGQHLTALLVGLRTIEEADDLQTATTRARDLREFTHVAHDDVRRLARGIGPVLLEELGLVAAIERLCSDFQLAHSVTATLHCDVATFRRIETEAETALYRILQEALTNVAQHAHASAVDVSLVESETSMTLSISDDGRGVQRDDAGFVVQQRGGIGLGSMRERALMLGGEFAMRSGRGNGTTIEVRVPVRC